MPNDQLSGSSPFSLHERHYHRAPTSAKSQLMGDDLLACVLGGVYTDVEKTLIELERGTIVQENRSAFQHACPRVQRKRAVRHVDGSLE